MVTGLAEALAAKGASGTIPIVMTAISDPIASGLVASLARPRGNVTGLSSLSFELNTKRLEILKDAVPKLTRVGLFRRSAASLQLKPIRAAAQSLKLKLDEIETQPDPNGLESAFQPQSRSRSKRL